MSTDAEAFDVLISGGGLVGTLLALALARVGRWRVGVIERTPATSTSLDALLHPSFDARNTAISNGTRELLLQLGAWPMLTAHAEPILAIAVSDEGSPAAVSIAAADEQVDALGYVIENRWIGHALMQCMREQARMQWISNATLSNPERRADGYALMLHTDGHARPVTTRLLIVAEGADSALCRQLGITQRVVPYGQTGIVTTVLPVTPHRGVAWERFTAGGPLALLPQTGGRLGVTWCVPDAQAESLMACHDTEFLTRLQQVSAGYAGTLMQVGRRVAYPLRQVSADEQIRPHLVVLGNAAHALHPVAGQGLNMALRDVVVLVRQLANAAPEVNPGCFSVLQTYLAERTPDQTWTGRFADGLTRLFSHPSAGLRGVRALGLTLFDVFPGAKQGLARHAMGRSVSMQLPGAVS